MNSLTLERPFPTSCCVLRQEAKKSLPNRTQVATKDWHPSSIPSIQKNKAKKKKERQINIKDLALDIL